MQIRGRWCCARTLLTLLVPLLRPLLVPPGPVTSFCVSWKARHGWCAQGSRAIACIEFIGPVYKLESDEAREHAATVISSSSQRSVFSCFVHSIPVTIVRLASRVILRRARRVRRPRVVSTRVMTNQRRKKLRRRRRKVRNREHLHQMRKSNQYEPLSPASSKRDVWLILHSSHIH